MLFLLLGGAASPVCWSGGAVPRGRAARHRPGHRRRADPGDVADRCGPRRRPRPALRRRLLGARRADPGECAAAPRHLAAGVGLRDGPASRLDVLHPGMQAGSKRNGCGSSPRRPGTSFAPSGAPRPRGCSRRTPRGSGALRPWRSWSSASEWSPCWCADGRHRPAARGGWPVCSPGVRHVDDQAAGRGVLQGEDPERQARPHTDADCVSPSKLLSHRTWRKVRYPATLTTSLRFSARNWPCRRGCRPVRAPGPTASPRPAGGSAGPPPGRATC